MSLGLFDSTVPSPALRRYQHFTLASPAAGDGPGRRQGESCGKKWKAGRMSESSIPPATHSSAEAGSITIFTERLWPGPWIWIIALGASLTGTLIFAPISITAGVIAAVLMAVISTVLLIVTTPTIIVTDTSLRVGRAEVDRRFVGEVEAFTGPAATEQRGTKLSGLAYLCFRGWISPVVRIEITDEADRTPYWLTSTRRPQQLVAALTAPRNTGE